MSRSRLFQILQVAATAPGNFQRFQAAGLLDSQQQIISNWDEAFQQLSPLTATEVRQNPSAFLANATDIVYRGMTSGTSGQSYTYFAPQLWNHFRIQSRSRGLKQWGIDETTPILNVGSRLLPLRAVDSSFIGPMTLEWIAKCLQILQQQSWVLRGYPSRLCEVAIGVKNQNFCPVQAVICTGEYLLEYQQELLTEVFQSPVINEYGCQEVGISGFTCPEFNHLHLDTERCWYEQVEGKMVATDLYNTVMPLVRYQWGDVLSLSPEPCACGRPGQVATIKGRITDQIRTQKGIQLLGDLKFPRFASISLYQITRWRDNQVQFNLIPESPLSLSLEELKTWSDENFGDIEAQIYLQSFPEPMTAKIEEANPNFWIKQITQASWQDWLKSPLQATGELSRVIQLLQQLVSPQWISYSGLSLETKNLLQQVQLKADFSNPTEAEFTQRILLFACSFLTNEQEAIALYQEIIQKLSTFRQLSLHTQLDLLILSLVLPPAVTQPSWEQYSNHLIGKKIPLDSLNIQHFLSVFEKVWQKANHKAYSQKLRPLLAILMGDFSFVSHRFQLPILSYWQALIQGLFPNPSWSDSIHKDKFLASWLQWRTHGLIVQETEIDLNQIPRQARNLEEKMRIQLERGYGLLLQNQQLDMREWRAILQKYGMMHHKTSKSTLDPVPWIPIFRHLAPSFLATGEREFAYECLLFSALPSARTSAFDRWSYPFNTKQNMVQDQGI